MEVNKVPDKKGGKYIMITSSDVEKINPIDYYSKWHMTSGRTLLEEIMKPYETALGKSAIENVIAKRVKKEWEEKYAEIVNTKIPENLIKLFDSQKKKDQVKLLRGFSINSDVLIAFIFYAWNNKGFSFSQYKGEHQRKGLDKKDLPTVVHIKEDEVERIGESKLTDGQLKQAIQQRTIVIAKFIDKGENWHCLFATYNSLKGEENWQNGQPHFHYISNKFGIPRSKVVESLKSRNYKLGSLPHISLTDYGPQPNDKEDLNPIESDEPRISNGKFSESSKQELLTSENYIGNYNSLHDNSLWKYIQKGNTKLTPKDYLDIYPNGKYSEQAKKELNK